MGGRGREHPTLLKGKSRGRTHCYRCIWGGDKIIVKSVRTCKAREEPLSFEQKSSKVWGSKKGGEREAGIASAEGDCADKLTFS